MNPGDLVLWVVIALLAIIAIRVLFGRRGTRAIARNAQGVVDRIKLEIEAISRDIAHGTFDRNVDRRISTITTLINQIADEDVALGMVLASVRGELARLQEELDKQVGYQKTYAQARERGVETSELDEIYEQEARVRVEALSQQIASFKNLENYVAKLQEMVRIAAAKGRIKQYSAVIEGSALKNLHETAETIHEILDEHVDTSFLEDPLSGLREIATGSASTATTRLAIAIGAPQEKEEKDPVALRAQELEEAIQSA